jgi:dTDP-glucose 4,6-dehydratase
VNEPGDRSLGHILVTGGAGFIGSCFVRDTLARRDGTRVTVLDKLTYAGSEANLAAVRADPEQAARFAFVRGDIADAVAVEPLVADADAVVNFAAESHVDRSILHAGEFVRTNVLGTNTLLDVARRLEVPTFLHVSTDETYGSIASGSFRESDGLTPSSPYSASKAGADLLAHAYWVTFRYPVMITRSSNNFGPYQFPEKMIPLFITNLLEDRAVPVYGDGLNVRDWIYVEDNCTALDLVLRKGAPGCVYNIGAGNELANLELTRRVLRLLGKPESLISYVTDRPGHDRRYSVDTTKVRALGWHPRWTFEAALAATVEWYRANRWWWEPLRAGSARVVERDLETPDAD